jgi:hypothetical protein
MDSECGQQLTAIGQSRQGDLQRILRQQSDGRQQPREGLPVAVLPGFDHASGSARRDITSDLMIRPLH